MKQDFYRVVGILADGESDSAIVMPIDSAVDSIEDAEPDVFDRIVVKADNVDNVETVVDDIEEKLMISRHVMNDDDRDFSVSDSLSMAESFSEMTASFTIFLGAIAGVSLVVGSVGGGLGILLSLVLTSFFPYLGLPMTRSSTGMTVAPDLMLLGIGIAMFIGVISGLIPAYNASKMKPVDALRYE